MAIEMKNRRAREDEMMQKMVSAEDTRALLVLCDKLGADESTWEDYLRQRSFAKERQQVERPTDPRDMRSKWMALGGGMKSQPLMVEDD
jgi:hypothetical protein